MFKFGKKKGPVLGLDVNSGCVSVVQLEKTKLGVELTRYASLPMPPNVVREGLIADAETVGSVVQELLSKAGLPPSGPSPQVNMIVPGQSVVVRLMPVPTGMPPDELADVVTQEAINHVPFPLNEANLDWSLMPATERTDADGVRRVDIILAAVQKTIVDSYWRMAESAGVTLNHMDISSLATIRALSFAGYLDQPDSLVMSVNIRQEATDINLIKGGMPLFSRSILLGMETLVEAVARSLELGVEEAGSILPAVQLSGMAALDQRTGQASQIARTVYGDIIDEVGRSLEFYRSQVGEVAIDQIVLCGPGCLVAQLDELVSGRLNIQATLADPFRALEQGGVPAERASAEIMAAGAIIDPSWLPVPVVDLDLNKEGPSLTALEGIERGTAATVQIVDLPTPWFMPALIGGLIALLSTIGIWLYYSQFDVPGKKAEVARLTEQIELAKKKVKDLSLLKEENSLLARKKKVLDQIVKVGRPWSAVLQSVSDSTPQGIQLKKANIAGSTIKLEGSAVDFTKISHFVINLNGVSLLDEAAIVSAKRDLQNDPRVVNFIVAVHVRPSGPAASRTLR